MAGVESPPFALQNASHGAQLFRLAASAFLGALQPVLLTSPLYGNPSGSTFVKGSQITAGHVGGVVGSNDFNITQNGSPNMSVNVAAGQVYIPGGSATEQGLYYGLSDATVNLPIAASNPTNPRIDTVVAYAEDSAYSGSNNDWNLGVVTGTATAGATLSNLSGAGSLAGFPNCVVLGFVLVPANASSIVTADILNSQPLASPGFSGFLQRGTPTLSGHLAADYNITTGLATFLTTASFSPGIWLVNATFLVNQGSSTDDIEITTTPGTASATFEGAYSANLVNTPASARVSLGLSFIATVTVAGTLTFKAVASATTTTPQIQSKTATGTYTNATGYTAVLVSG